MICDAQPPSTQDSQSLQELTISRRLNRKTDIALLPFLSLLYLFNGLDRSNIGNAQTQGTQHERHRNDTLYSFPNQDLLKILELLQMTSTWPYLFFS
jgi:hypothetical protein